MLFRILIVLLAAAVVSERINAQHPGDLDPGFGNEGVQLIPISSLNAFGQDIAIQPDGKVVVACIANNGLTTDFTLVRLMPNGLPDLDFGEEGIVMTDFDLRSDIAQTVALDGLNRIIIAGHVDSGNGFVFAAARYLQDGLLDESFGDQGKVITPLGTTSFVKGMAIQEDQKIVIAGYTLNPVSLTNEFVVVRYREDGQPDSTFHEDGIVMTNMGIGSGVAGAMLVQPDGKILVAGEVFNEATSLWEIGMARYHTNGSLDESFDEDGLLFTGTPLLNHSVRAIALDRNKKIVVGGFIGTAPSNNKFAIARYHPDGQPDNSFNGDGMLVETFGAQNNQIVSIVLQPDDKILVGGTTLVGIADRMAVARIDDSGKFDPSFGDGGIVQTVIAQNDGIKSMTLQSDGKLVVSGESFNGVHFSVGVARFETGLTTSLDPNLTYLNISVFPNPVVDELNVSYELERSSEVRISLYDQAGKLIHNFSELEKEAGNHTEKFVLPANIMPGVYSLLIAADFGMVGGLVVCQP